MKITKRKKERERKKRNDLKGKSSPPSLVWERTKGLDSMDTSPIHKYS